MSFFKDYIMKQCNILYLLINYQDGKYLYNKFIRHSVANLSRACFFFFCLLFQLPVNLKWVLNIAIYWCAYFKNMQISRWKILNNIIIRTSSIRSSRMKNFLQAANRFAFMPQPIGLNKCSMVDTKCLYMYVWSLHKRIFKRTNLCRLLCLLFVRPCVCPI